ncbi:YqhA family protein [Deinococcus sonorensis]|uniref:YqhA family protein n=2 Tax=Deinococcus sonorensis TaxID=309891 RepID=A0AAU7U7Q2_9DEIO
MSRAPQPPPASPSFFTQFIGRTRFVVVVAVVAVLLVAFSLFLQGTLQAVLAIYTSWRDIVDGIQDTEQVVGQKVAVQFLEIVSVMLKAVVFYLIGLGLYSLFIAPLNLASSLGVESLADLEQKVVSVVIVILSVTFLEHFVAWEDPQATLFFGASLALAVGALVFFQRVSRDGGERLLQPAAKLRARRELFEDGSEEGRVEAREVDEAEQLTAGRTASGEQP